MYFHTPSIKHNRVCSERANFSHNHLSSHANTAYVYPLRCHGRATPCFQSQVGPTLKALAGIVWQNVTTFPGLFQHGMSLSRTLVKSLSQTHSSWRRAFFFFFLSDWTKNVPSRLHSGYSDNVGMPPSKHSLIKTQTHKRFSVLFISIFQDFVKI